MAATDSQSSGRPVSLYAAFEAVATKYADKTALIGSGGKGLALTYREALTRIQQLAAGLQTPEFSGLSEIGLISENRPEWPIAYLAIVAAGKTVVPLDANLHPGEIEAIIRHAGLSVLFVSGRFEPVVASFGPDLRLFSFESESPNNWSKLVSSPVDFTPLGSRETVASLIYTSGTTGAPKAVILTHGNLLANLEAIDKAIHFDERDVQLSLLPLHHTFETTCGFLTPLIHGATIVYARGLKSKEVLEDISANRVTLMCGVPLLYEKMYHSIHRKVETAPLIRRLMFRLLLWISALGWQLGRRWGRGLFAGVRRRAGLADIRMFVSGAAALPPNIQRFFVLIGFDFLQGYGMTEASPVISVNRADSIVFGSVGPPLDGVEVRIDRPDENGIGEIIVRGENCTSGYKNNPEQTAELWRNGWLHTGDLGTFRDGQLWITGRAKNLIVSAAGKNIYPEELEEKLSESDYILEVIVFGRAKHGRHGEEVRALIVPDIEQFQLEFGLDPAQPNADLVREILSREVAMVNAEIADYKRITGFEVHFQELEKTSTKKVKRFVYR
ncbi:MAG: AMP-binding protein [Candidatus Zixiibacteriota bacterium]